MKQKITSFLIAFAVLAGLLTLNAVFHVSERQAMASPAYSAGAAISEKVFTPSEKRQFRKALYESPAGFTSLTGNAIRAVLDQPEMVRQDLPTTVWQYRNDECVLDLYFKSDEGSVGEITPIHYEMRARAGKEQDAAVQNDCVANLLLKNVPVSFAKLEKFF